MPTAILLDILSEESRAIALEGVANLLRGVWKGDAWEPVAVLHLEDDPTSKTGLKVKVAAELGESPSTVLTAIEKAASSSLLWSSEENDDRGLMPQGRMDSGVRLEALLTGALQHFTSSGAFPSQDASQVVQDGGGTFQAGCGGCAGHAVVVTAAVNTTTFPIPQEIFSAYSRPWMRLHLFDLTPPTPSPIEAPTLRRICAATGGAYVALGSEHDSLRRNRAVETVVSSHFSPYQGTLRCGHLQGSFSLHPNPNFSARMPGQAAFPTIASVLGFFDAVAVQSAPIRSQFVLLGTPPVKDDSRVDASTNPPHPATSGDAHMKSAPWPLDPVSSLLRAVLGGTSPQGTPHLIGSSPAALVLLGSWAQVSKDDCKPTDDGGVGFLTAVTDTRGGQHLVLTVLNEIAGREMPFLLGDPSEQPMNGVGLPLTSPDSIEKCFSKIARYVKKLPDLEDRFKAECAKVDANAAVFGVAENCNSKLLQMLESELEAQQALLSVAKCKKRNFVDGNQQHQHHTRKAKSRTENAANEIDTEVKNLDAACTALNAEVLARRSVAEE